VSVRTLEGPPTHEERANGWHATRLYASFREMRSRCGNPKHVSYHNYGGRGIRVCRRWSHPTKGWSRFVEDMGDRPENTSWDRIDPEGNYSPKNCRWANRHQQANNRRDSAKLRVGRRVQTLTQWAMESGTPRSTIVKRLSRGKSPREAVFGARKEAKQIRAFGRSQTLSEWAAERGLNASTLYDRIYRREWGVEKALSRRVR